MRGLLISVLLGGIAAPALAQGAVGTIARGSYVCELPGDALGSAGVEQPAQSFTIESASRYSSPQGAGTYLRRGDTVVLTSGPRQGESYALISGGFLRRVEDGRPGRLRCVRDGR